MLKKLFDKMKKMTKNVNFVKMLEMPKTDLDKRFPNSRLMFLAKMQVTSNDNNISKCYNNYEHFRTFFAVHVYDNDPI